MEGRAIISLLDIGQLQVTIMWWQRSSREMAIIILQRSINLRYWTKLGFNYGLVQTDFFISNVTLSAPYGDVHQRAINELWLYTNEGRGENNITPCSDSPFTILRPLFLLLHKISPFMPFVYLSLKLQERSSC